jgi:hypothetical protein
MNHIACMKIAETFCNIYNLKTGEAPFGWRVRGTHEINQIYVIVVPDVFSQLAARHPFWYELKGFEGNSLEWHDIWMNEVFPNHSFPAKGLQGSSGHGNSAEKQGDGIPV